MSLDVLSLLPLNASLEQSNFVLQLCWTFDQEADSLVVGLEPLGHFEEVHGVDMLVKGLILGLACLLAGFGQALQLHCE